MQYLAAWAKNKVLPGFDTIEILGFFTNSARFLADLCMRLLF
jgi:hypothetical protein